MRWLIEKVGCIQYDTIDRATKVYKQCLIICLVNCSTHTHTFPTTPHINTVVIFSRFQLVSFETAKLNLVVCRSVSWKLLSGVLCGCTKEMIGCIAVYICCTTCFARSHAAWRPSLFSLCYSCAVQVWACAHIKVVCTHTSCVNKFCAHKSCVSKLCTCITCVFVSICILYPSVFNHLHRLRRHALL